MKKKLILIGGGGHCKACIDVIEQSGNFTIFGILDQKDLVGQTVLGYPILGSDIDVVKYVQLGYSFLNTIGQIKSAHIRRAVHTHLVDCEANIVTIISPHAYVSKHAKIGDGTIVMHNATVNAGARIGANCILNTGCNVEHDTVIGNHVHVSTLAVVNGNCEIEDNVFIGSNATISNQVKILKNTIIGAGAVVARDINEKGVYVGNPVKKID